MFIKYAGLIVSQRHHKYLQNDGQKPHGHFIVSIILNNDPNKLFSHRPIVVDLYTC